MFTAHEPANFSRPGTAAGAEGTTEQDKQCPALMEFAAYKQVFIKSVYVGITLHGRD